MYCSCHRAKVRLAAASLATAETVQTVAVFRVLSLVSFGVSRRSCDVERLEFYGSVNALAFWWHETYRRGEMARSAGVEPTTFGFGGQHSIQLSYERFVFPVLLERQGRDCKPSGRDLGRIDRYFFCELLAFRG